MLSIRNVLGSRAWRYCGALLFATAALGARPAAAQQKPSEAKAGAPAGRTIIGNQPWDPESLQAISKLIYGTDDRIDVYQETNPVRQRLAAATCGLLSVGELTPGGNGTFTIDTSTYMQLGLPACLSEPYRTQPTAMFCTGFLIGEDIVATAGHCYDSNDLSSVRFVFGFQMANASTAVTTVNADRVYQGAQILGHQLAGDYDYTILKLDRKVTAPGAFPLPIRRTGAPGVGAPVGVIGHPAGLPMKVAFGPATSVKQDADPAFFVANLDTYGGNSGSPVFHQNSGLVEGILVRGQVDFVSQGGCFVSNQMADNEGGEDVSRAASFLAAVPEWKGIRFDRSQYQTGTTATVEILDEMAAGSFLINLSSSEGDLEPILVSDPDGDDLYTASFQIGAADAEAVTANGTLEGGSSATLTAAYNDPTPYPGYSASRTATSVVDGASPEIWNISVSHSAVDYADLSVTLNEIGSVQILGGTTCGDRDVLAESGPALNHVIRVSNLLPCTTYFFAVYATDGGGNMGGDSNTEECFTIQTHFLGDTVFADTFEPAPSPAWISSAAAGANNWAVRSDGPVHSAANSYSFTPGLASVGDASLTLRNIPGGSELEFYHAYSFETGGSGGIYDGGVLEMSLNNGASWADAGSLITQGGYNGTISTLYNNPISGRAAWTGGSTSAWTRVKVDLTAYPGAVWLRWRFGSDTSNSSGGWFIDDVQVKEVDSCQPAAADPAWLTVD